MAGAIMDASQKILEGDIRFISRYITKIERQDDDAIEVLKRLYPHTGHAAVIGLTGAPGAGKSSMTNCLIAAYLKKNMRVAVLAVDPSSEFTGGGILGDRIRMPVLDERLYIRSFGSRGHLGGLSIACGDAIHLLDAAGFDRILVETVGTGQSETEIKEYANTVIVVTNPNQGDDIQAMKAGIFEIGDIFVVNKADLPGADQTESDLIHMTHLLAGKAPIVTSCCSCPVVEDKAINADSTAVRIPPVIKVSAKTGQGFAELVEAIEDHLGYLQANNLFLEKQRKIARKELEGAINLYWQQNGMLPLQESARWQQICEDVAAKKTDPWTASEFLCQTLSIEWEERRT